MTAADLASYLSNSQIYGTDLVFIKTADGVEHAVTNVIIERADVSIFPTADTPTQKIILEF